MVACFSPAFVFLGSSQELKRPQWKKNLSLPVRLVGLVFHKVQQRKECLVYPESFPPSKQWKSLSRGKQSALSAASRSNSDFRSAVLRCLSDIRKMCGSFERCTPTQFTRTLTLRRRRYGQMTGIFIWWKSLFSNIQSCIKYRFFNLKKEKKIHKYWNIFAKTIY